VDTLIAVDLDTGLAPWRQIRDQLAASIDGGGLAPGAKLPPIRRLARDLGIAPGTVARAYRELETAGRIRTGRGAGTVVVGPGGPPPSPVLHGAAHAYAAAARGEGATLDEALAALRAAW
jgi:GntR family transcriptional regulator